MENSEILRFLVHQFPSIYHVSKVLEVTEKTINNWIEGKTPCSSLAIKALRLEICNKQHYFELDAIISTQSHLNGKIFARLESTTTYGDLNKLLAYFYLRIERIQRIIFFSREAISEDNNKDLLGCLMITDKESVLLDTSSLTGARNPREYEIISFFKHIYGNGCYEKIELITKKIPATGNFNAEEACNLITNHPTEKINYASILIFLALIRGSLFGADPSQYLFDDDISTLTFIVEKTLNDLTGVKFEFKENTFLLFIENSGNFRHIYTKLFQCLLDIYGEPKNGYFMRYNEVKNKYIKVDLPLTLNNDTYKISLKISREKKYIENNI